MQVQSGLFLLACAGRARQERPRCSALSLGPVATCWCCDRRSLQSEREQGRPRGLRIYLAPNHCIGNASLSFLIGCVETREHADGRHV